MITDFPPSLPPGNAPRPAAPVLTTSIESKMERAIEQCEKEMESGAIDIVRGQTAMELMGSAKRLIERARVKTIAVDERPIV
ncbi:hypothetical protein IT570_03405 [Candidatus Sumerlaeota bacterium]|nr:hypothetical protein [Candidatus Sumerlaeota bacterium]